LIYITQEVEEKLMEAGLVQVEYDSARTPDMYMVAGFLVDLNYSGSWREADRSWSGAGGI
jgi:hypothetical protein